MAIYITGDIHGDHTIRKFSSYSFKEGKSLTKDDYVIIAGDFGVIWNWQGKDDSEQYWLDWLDEKPWTTLFVDGNHENFDRLNAYPVEQWNGGKIHRISDSVIHLMRGQVFTLHGKKFFTMGGAYSHDIEYRTPNKSWWPQEVPSAKERNEALMNLDDNNWCVDYVITHDAPRPIAGDMLRIAGIWSRRTLDDFEDWLDNEIARKLDFKMWFFGHHHIDYELHNGKYQAMYHDIVSLDNYEGNRNV